MLGDSRACAEFSLRDAAKSVEPRSPSTFLVGRRVTTRYCLVFLVIRERVQTYIVAIASAVVGPRPARAGGQVVWGARRGWTGLPFSAPSLK